ncbi:hypothetical protein [Pedobacter puniceum]|jgi:hypothetical protein|uniref:Uncharacterized protein n=1 Tax=Pedobacter puniceum TaxID=2666136 RepID=A0A7K0FK95_9SPHI|nr:hypothetical protein [Pedobacter puniceum]MRX46394.1 hypothetical protein [Pedobacter puniceum]
MKINIASSVKALKSKSALQTNFNHHQHRLSEELNKGKQHVLYTSLLYVLSILSIGSWIISLKLLPFGDMFQFLLGAAVLTVNLLIFRHAKI